MGLTAFATPKPTSRIGIAFAVTYGPRPRPTKPNMNVVLLRAPDSKSVHGGASKRRRRTKASLSHLCATSRC